ncbi:hypothetical protein Goklo_010875 [Gossypium klotzschianum]|uniref:NAD(P)-binding domain-containing protein n=2 Tax=Gossypium TaxID=3633 RepID=A0A7J8V7F0_9ROSI|nr:hypothetical protein [Gossypium klotzschianum]
MAGTLSSSTLHCQTYLVFTSQNPLRTLNSSFLINFEKRALIRCSAKKKIGFVDQILDYIEGGPKLRKWYGAPELLPKDGPIVEDQEEEDYPEDEVRDAVLVTDGDSEIGQASYLTDDPRVKALVKDKRSANEAFGTYVESISGETSNKVFVKKALRGVRAIICPNEGFLSSIESFKGVEHIVLLSQLFVYRASSGIQAIMKNNQRKIAEKDESVLMASGIPYTIVRAGMLQKTPGGTQGFSFEEGCSASGSLSMEDAASLCVEALEVVPQARFTFEVVNGGEKVSDWKECLTRLIGKTEQ